MLRRSTTAIFLAALLASAASATPWHAMGPRAMGMGGAHVAMAQGPLASYWNPAGLGQLYNVSGLLIPAGIRIEATGSVLEGANDLYQLNEDCAAGLSSCSVPRIVDALDRLGQSGNGAFADSGGGVNLKIKRAVLFVNTLSYLGGAPQVDFVNTLAGQGAGSIAQNQSKIIVRGGNFTEIGVGYGREIRESGVVLGANLKGIVGQVGYKQIGVVLEEPDADAFSDFRDESKTSIQPGVDVGLLWDIRETWPKVPMRPRFGLVGRNLNNPKFNQPDAAKAAGEFDKFSIHGQARAGFAMSPFKFWHLAADIDVTNNLTYIPGFKSRYLSLGTEINVFNRPWLNIPLRAGIQKNLSDTGSGASYTAGVGLNFLHVMLDIGGMISAKTTRIQSEGETDKIPNNAAFSARFAFLFGGKDEGTRNK
ncbi:MAG: conjugal transfer protein TraF [Elusimicrobiota bacterium]